MDNLKGGTGFHGERVVYMNPASKGTTGRLLDGIEHNSVPGAMGDVWSNPKGKAGQSADGTRNKSSGTRHDDSWGMGNDPPCERSACFGQHARTSSKIWGDKMVTLCERVRIT